VHGNVWNSSKDSNQVYVPDATLPGRAPERVGNVRFGGPDGCNACTAASSNLSKSPTQTRGTALWGR
jgi:gluconolactonase